MSNVLIYLMGELLNAKTLLARVNSSIALFETLQSCRAL